MSRSRDILGGHYFLLSTTPTPPPLTPAKIPASRPVKSTLPVSALFSLGATVLPGYIGSKRMPSSNRRIMRLAGQTGTAIHVCASTFFCGGGGVEYTPDLLVCIFFYIFVRVDKSPSNLQCSGNSAPAHTYTLQAGLVRTATTGHRTYSIPALARVPTPPQTQTQTQTHPRPRRRPKAYQ